MGPYLSCSIIILIVSAFSSKLSNGKLEPWTDPATNFWIVGKSKRLQVSIGVEKHHGKSENTLRATLVQLSLKINEKKTFRIKSL